MNMNKLILVLALILVGTTAQAQSVPTTVMTSQVDAHDADKVDVIQTQTLVVPKANYITQLQNQIESIQKALDAKKAELKTYKGN